MYYLIFNTCKVTKNAAIFQLTHNVPINQYIIKLLKFILQFQIKANYFYVIHNTIKLNCSP
jgi:hypothetical protein